MTFPHYFHLFGHAFHPHPVMEALAYAVGFATHAGIKRRLRGSQGESLEQVLWTIAGAIVGALVGAKLLVWVEHFHELTAAGAEAPGLEKWIGGKTIVGGLVGGWLGVEIAKRAAGIRRRTGDAWVYPLCLSIAIGRVGCFLTGLSDQTHGVASALPWAVDFGDGIPRHPTQLYEIAFLLLLMAGLWVYQRAAGLTFASADGRLFRMFMLAYCLWRFLVEFIKPTEKPFLGLSAIQVVCAATAIVAAASLIRMMARRPRVRGFSK